MYERFKDNALMYYNPDGELKEYRFKRNQILELIEECDKNNEHILGIVVLLEPSENDYGEPCAFFNTDDLRPEDFDDYTTSIASLAKKYIQAIDEDGDDIYYTLELKSSHLRP